MRIIIKNDTLYSTKELRVLLMEAARRVGVKEDKLVRIVSSRTRDFVSGWGWYGTRRCEARAFRTDSYFCHVLLRIPPPKITAFTERELALEVAATAGHEFMHNLGVRHRDMTEEQRYAKRSFAEKWEGLNGVVLTNPFALQALSNQMAALEPRRG